MDEIDKNSIEELKKVVGFDEIGEHRKKEVRIIKDKKQYTVRIPKRFSEIINIDEEKDTFEWHLIPDDNNEGKFLLEGYLIRGNENVKD
jgi:L-lysine 2,3-aminomutase